MEKISALWAALHKGSEVVNAEAWKSHQITANTVAAFLAALVLVAKAFGLQIPLGDGDITAIAGGVFAIVNMAFTAATSKRAGLPAKPIVADDVPPVGQPAPQPDAGQPTDWRAVADRDYSPER